MGRISGWWLGAVACVPRSKLYELARRVGGFSALEQCTPAELNLLGVEAALVERWFATPDGQSMGEGITLADPRYPRGLADDDQSPPVLYCQGNVELLDATVAVAVVGTRRCSGRGSALARGIGRELAAAGAVVVSGLARGIDTAAHAGALAAGGGRTIAVLGHGLGHTSPASNRRLRQRIVDEGGLVVSGWADGLRPERWTFPARNRWVAGLSQSVVVVEAPGRSGALITAQDALSLGKDVWVAPGHPDDPLAEGPLQLLAEQRETDDTERDMLRLRLGQAVELLDGDREPSGAVLSALAGAVRPPEGPRVRGIHSVAELVQAHCGAPSDQQEAWLAQLLAGAPVDQVARAWGRPVLELQHELTRRELAGEVVRLPGGRYGRAR